MLWTGFALQIHAQGLKRMLHKTDSILSLRYQRSKVDTMYITRPKTKWTIRGRLNVSGADLEIKEKQFGVPFHSKMKADYKSTLSFVDVTTSDIGNGKDVIVVSGLKVGDKIVTEGANNVQEGQKVLFPKEVSSEK